MPYWLIALYLFHVGAGLYWMISSFLAALAKGKEPQASFRLQMVAAFVTFAVGGVLWREMHAYQFGAMEALLAVGVVCAVLAAAVQGARVGGSLRKLRQGSITKQAALDRIRMGHRVAAALLALALLCMVGSYHV
jgi:hypothetical protein